MTLNRKQSTVPSTARSPWGPGRRAARGAAAAGMVLAVALLGTACTAAEAATRDQPEPIPAERVTDEKQEEGTPRPAAPAEEPAGELSPVPAVDGEVAEPAEPSPVPAEDGEVAEPAPVPTVEDDIFDGAEPSPVPTVDGGSDEGDLVVTG